MNTRPRLRGPGGWAFSPQRLVVALAVLAIGWFAIADSLANVVARGDAVTAARLAPWNARIHGRASAQLMAIAPVAAKDSATSALARKALRGDPTNTNALATLALQAQLRNETETSRSLFSYSLKLSRREWSARLWAIEEAVGRGDIREALVNYDRALRTSSQAAPVLFPILSKALTEPLVRQSFLNFLGQRPPWLADFVTFAARDESNPSAMLAFVREAESRGGQLPFGARERQLLTDGLLIEKRYDEAWSFYAADKGNIDRARSRDPRFANAIDNPSLFDWRALDFAALQKGGSRTFLEYFAPSTSGGIVAQQYQALPPGQYIIDGEYQGGRADQSPPFWSVNCTDGLELVRIEMAGSAEPRRFRTTFTVTATCPLQALNLNVRPNSIVGGSEGRVLRINLRPAGDASISRK